MQNICELLLDRIMDITSAENIPMIIMSLVVYKKICLDIESYKQNGGHACVGAAACHHRPIRKF